MKTAAKKRTKRVPEFERNQRVKYLDDMGEVCYGRIVDISDAALYIEWSDMPNEIIEHPRDGRDFDQIKHL